ncbi:transcription antitermination factor NusB [candidate division CPR3 bacterium 4484_211]|uniref:Transcription antitermination protein NusB n=1 Tax=candidate division CPR3 bacterium 4484_211 TaxID=1968527 RepID=A0A1W9NZ17_UNCC3|nr:MAG: transcription antitermination factor NusB [candidate division CPR3 bacterium 4484_211]
MKKSTDPRHRARQLALKVLFAWASNYKLKKKLSKEEKRSLVKEARLVYKTQIADFRQQPGNVLDADLAKKIIHQVIKYHRHFDKIIGQAAPEWPLDQIAIVDLTVLRMALSELTQEKAPPRKVVIDEAVELGKEFGGANSSKFINGVLGTIVEKMGEEK